ncbi:MAG: hypothetical protein GYB65_18945, partial [Chloroflexi bacterium]|nr:hypothetical protein [Chloroflexota bacterium]
GTLVVLTGNQTSEIQRVHVYDLINDTTLVNNFTLPFENLGFVALSLNPDATLAVAAQHACGDTVWPSAVILDVATGTVLTEFRGGAAPLTFSPDGTHLVLSHCAAAGVYAVPE